MAKKDKLEEKKKELSDALEEFKSDHPDLTEDELKFFESMVDNIASIQSKGLFSRIKDLIIDFLQEYIVMLVASIIMAGFLFNHFVPKDKWLILAVSGITSVVLMIVFRISAVFDQANKGIKISIIFALMLLFAYLLNTNVYKIFDSSVIWIVYTIATLIIYVIFTFYIIKRKLASLRR